MRNVIGNYKISDGKNRGIALVFLTCALFFTGCNASRDSICKDFPAVADEISGIQTQIAAADPRPESKRGAKAGRKIASVIAVVDDNVDHREAWLEWGEKALKRTQWAKDALEDDNRGRKAIPALNDAGLSLVSFHGFLDQRKWRKAGAELDRVEASLVRARKIACDVEAPPSPPKKTAKKHAK
jgi:hypothetical protein